MTRVKLGGRELTVPDNMVTEYLGQGYSVIDSRGNTLEVGKLLTYEQAITENNRLSGNNKRLKAGYDGLVIENAMLRSELEIAINKIAELEAAAKKDNIGEEKPKEKTKK